MSAALSRQPPRGRRIRDSRASSPSRLPFTPQLKWLTTRPRSVTCRDVKHGSPLEVDKFAARAPQTPQKETEDKVGQTVAAGDPKTPIANPSRPRVLQIRHVQASPQPSATSYEFFATSSSLLSSPSEESGLNWQTVPVVEAAILPPGRRLHMTVAPQIVKQETHDSEFHFSIPKRNKISTQSHTRTIKQELLFGVQSGIPSGKQSWQAASPFPFKYSSSTMSPPSTERGASRRGRGRPRGFQRRLSPPETGTGSTSSYTLPPHPYTTGKVSKANICPICEKYTVTELDRPADSDPSGESLRARFKCEHCRNVFDLSIPLFDPRGSPGVTLYEGEDRFVPPVPPRATYPCPRCWMTSSESSFQCMTVYLKEESRVACDPVCRTGRTRGANKEQGVTTTEKRTTRQSSK